MPAGRPIENRLLRELWMLKLHAALRVRNARGFRFEGKRYPFLFRSYNRTWYNERQVEVPVAWRVLASAPGPRVLEVGNVLSHYGRVRHAVVDKYEEAPGVANEDFLDHEGGPYDLILSISTFEHIGWDEPAKDATGFLRAMEHAKALLAPGGRLVVTVPLGYNPEVDRFVARPPDDVALSFLERYGPRPGEWRQARRCSGATHPYDPSGFARAVAVLRHEAPRAGR